MDDERDIRETLREAFEDEGFMVAVAANGREGMDRLAEVDGDCVLILDLIMPIMGGTELYEVMQRHPRFADTPVIVTTSDPARAPAGVLVMRKPLKLQQLIDAVNGLAVRRRKTANLTG